MSIYALYQNQKAESQVSQQLSRTGCIFLQTGPEFRPLVRGLEHMNVIVAVFLAVRERKEGSIATSLGLQSVRRYVVSKTP